MKYKTDIGHEILKRLDLIIICFSYVVFLIVSLCVHRYVCESVIYLGEPTYEVQCVSGHSYSIFQRLFLLDLNGIKICNIIFVLLNISLTVPLFFLSTDYKVVVFFRVINVLLFIFAFGFLLYATFTQALPTPKFISILV